MEVKNVPLLESDGILSHLSSYLPDVSAYLPQELMHNMSRFHQDAPKSFTAASSASVSSVPTTMSSSSSCKIRQFDESVVSFDVQSIPCAAELRPSCVKIMYNVAYSNGFQVWDITDVNKMVEMVSKRGFGTRIVKVIPPPMQERWENAEMRCVVVPHDIEDASWSKSARIFSFDTQRFDGGCSKVVVGRMDDNHLNMCATAVYSSTTLEFVRELASTPTSKCPRSVALGSRWVAYPSKASLTESIKATNSIPAFVVDSNNQWINHNHTKSQHDYSVSEVAQGVASGLYYLGKLGVRTVTPYLTGSDAKVKNVENWNEGDGTVVVRDLCSNEVLSCFNSHREPLSMIRFDPSGTLLLTAPVAGQTMHIHKLMPSAVSGKGSTNTLLYKILRGITHAEIQDAVFSDDARLLVLSSSRGTSHIYTINTEGGPIHAQSYVSDNDTLSSSSLSESSDAGEKSLATLLDERNRSNVLSLSACSRLRVFDPKLSTTAACKRDEDDESEASADSIAISVKCTFVGSKLLVSSMGHLSQVQLNASMHSSESLLSLMPTNSSLNHKKADAIVFAATNHRRWDMRRDVSSREVCWNNTTKQESQKRPFYPGRLVGKNGVDRPEICTHLAPLLPMWAHPKIKFKVLDEKAKCLKTNHALFLDDLPTKTLLVNRRGPVPMDATWEYPSVAGEESPTLMGLGNSPLFSGANGEYVDLVVPKLQLEASISMAISTPVKFADERAVSVNEGSGPQESATPVGSLETIHDSYFGSQGSNIHGKSTSTHDNASIPILMLNEDSTSDEANDSTSMSSIARNENSNGSKKMKKKKNR